MTSLSPTTLPPADITAEQLEQGSSLWHDAWARLRKNKLAVFGGAMLVTLTAMCVLLPLVFDLSYEAQGLSIGGLPPGSKVVKIYDATGGRGMLEVSNLENLKLDQVFGSGPAAE